MSGEREREHKSGKKKQVRNKCEKHNRQGRAVALEKGTEQQI